ncbi:hypothetical protein ACFPLB_06165 [Aquamicrobium segne]|uniref:Uncharacterized protein n=1 Tax=Aquamicrobium segne TaxID=469547 RepID=A0ABW0GYU3_9HYPH
MIGNQQETGLANPLRQYNDAGTQALQQAATRLKTMRPGNSRFRTKDLVGLLMSHGARTWRNTQPLVQIRLKAATPDGKAAIRLKF